MAKWVLLRTYKVQIITKEVEAETEDEAIHKFDLLVEKDTVEWLTEIPVAQLDEFGDLEDEQVVQEVDKEEGKDGP